VDQRDGATAEMYMGHDRGIPIKFFNHAEKNESQTKLLGYPKYNEIEMVQWVLDKNNKYCERVRLLPEELLSFNAEGECTSGKFKDAYLSFKAGKNAPGMALLKWGKLSDADCATLRDMGVYSVEQFAVLPKDKFSKCHAEIREGYEEAKLYMSNKDQRTANKVTEDALIKLALEKEKMSKEMEELRGQIAGLGTGKPKGRKPGVQRREVQFIAE